MLHRPALLSVLSPARLIVALAGTAGATGASAQTLPNGVAAGDTTPVSTVLWARAAEPGDLVFEYSTDPEFGEVLGEFVVPVDDITVPAKVEVGGLAPSTVYHYRATDTGGNISAGRFRTHADPGAHTGLRFGVSGDWRGELAPYPSVRNVAAKAMDLWVALGDTIYADVPSPDMPKEQAETLEEFRIKHNEVYAERFGLNTLADLRASTSTLAMIDDHEVTNDFAGGAHPSTDPRFENQPGDFINETPLYIDGLRAFGEYNPIIDETYEAAGDPRTDGKPRLYRSRLLGADAAVIMADARSFRDEELPPANPLDPGSVASFLINSFDPSRTMLSTRQLADLKADLLDAHHAGATWKFVLVPEPIQNLGVVAASDRYEGYAAERADLLRFVVEHRIANVVFVAADIHGTLVNNVTYQNGPFQEQIPTGAFEITTGAVAYHRPFGPTVADLAYNLGIPGTIPLEEYEALPLELREAYITGLINAQIVPLGYDPLGLEGSEIDATLLEGGYTATNSYGWTEFEINAQSRALTITTWGVPYYSEDELNADPDAITALEPEVYSRFAVAPKASCAPDLDGSGSLDLFDFLEYVNAFNSGQTVADCTGDGVLDLFDYLCFVNLFEQGCV